MSETVATHELRRLPSGGLLRVLASTLRRTSKDRSGAGPRLMVRGITVDLDHLAAYARICGFGLTDTLGPTYPHVLAFRLSLALLTHSDFPFPAVGLVHVKNTTEHIRPVSADEPLDLLMYATAPREHNRGQITDMVIEATVDGIVVWRESATLLRMARPAPTPATAKATIPAQRERPPVPEPQSRWQVTPATAAEYAKVSGDANPIHTSRLGARVFGFPQRIAHGMWSLARCLAALQPRLPQQYTVEAEFKRPILLPGNVAFSSQPQETGWGFALHDAASGIPHLRGTISRSLPGAAGQ